MMDTSGTAPPEEDVVRWVDSQKGTVLRRDTKALVQKRLDQKGPVRDNNYMLLSTYIYRQPSQILQYLMEVCLLCQFMR